MQVGLGPGDIVLDGDPVPPKGAEPTNFSADFVLDANPAPPPQKGGGAPKIFGPCLLWPNS